jgi:sugar lactone lactonase YvrE
MKRGERLELDRPPHRHPVMGAEKGNRMRRTGVGVAVVLMAGLWGCQPTARPGAPLPERFDTTLGTVSVVAGGIERGTADGPAAQARFHSPIDVAVGDGGEVYVADWGNGLIRRLGPDGRVTTLSQPPAGGATSPAASTLQPIGVPADRFDSPVAVAADGAGGVLVLDGSQRRICRLSSDGKATVVAQSPLIMAAASPAPEAGTRFVQPSSLALTKTGTIVVADREANRILQVSPTGGISVLAGGEQGNLDGPASSARFYHPLAVACAPDGTIIVADAGNYRIRKIAADGTVTTIAADAGTIPAAAAEVPADEVGVPRGIAVDRAGRIYVMEAVSGGLVRRVRRLDPGGGAVTLWRSRFPQSAGEVVSLPFATLTTPLPPPDWQGDGLDVDAQGRVYFLENQGANRVLRFAPQSGV